MRKWEFDFMECLLKKLKRKDELLGELRELPEGSLIKKKKGDRTEFYVRYNDTPAGKQIYLSIKKDLQLINALQNKADTITAIKAELDFIEIVVKKMKPIARQIKESFNLQKPEIYKPVASDKKDPDNQLSIRTERGEMVRSKSERFIADAMYKFNLDYRYEQRLDLGGIIFHPDFTIVNPLNGKIYYLEHLGLNDPDYIADWFTRKSVYNENGIVENQNLIVTTENDLNRFDAIIAKWFTFDRYSEIFEAGR